MNKPSRSLHRLFTKQQQKVRANQQTARLLKAYAENDHKRMALLIDKWLKES